MTDYKKVVNDLMDKGVMYDDWSECGSAVLAALRKAHRNGRAEAFEEVKAGKPTAKQRRKL